MLTECCQLGMLRLRRTRVPFLLPLLRYFAKVSSGTCPAVRFFQCRSCNFLVGQHEDFDDLHQTASLEIARSMSRFRQSRLTTWIGGICVDVSRAHLRKKKRRERFHSDDSEVEAAEGPGRREICLSSRVWLLIVALRIGSPPPFTGSLARPPTLEMVLEASAPGCTRSGFRKGMNRNCTLVLRRRRSRQSGLGRVRWFYTL